MSVAFIDSKPNDGFHPHDTPFPSLIVGRGKKKLIYLKVDAVFGNDKMPRKITNRDESVASARFTGKTKLYTEHEIEVAGHRQGTTVITADYGNGFQDTNLTIHVFHTHSYVVPGHKVVLKQPTNSVCWATVYTMMLSWKEKQRFDIGEAVGRVGAY